MSNYTKATNFATKDTLPTGDSNKIVKGTEIDNEFNSISGAISSKSDIASPTFTGTPAAPTATAGSNTTQIATTAFVTASLSVVYPVGSIYINATSSSNPATLLGFGTWTAFGAGRVMVGLDAGDALFNTAEETGGSKDAIVVSHSHVGGAHTHTILRATAADINPSSGTEFVQGGAQVTATDSYSTSSGGAVNTTTVGSSGTNANLQPYITVRMWKRTA